MINLNETKNIAVLLRDADFAIKKGQRNQARELYLTAYYKEPLFATQEHILHHCPELENFPAFDKDREFCARYARTLIDDAYHWRAKENPRKDGEIEWHKSYAEEGLVTALLYDPSRQEEVFKFDPKIKEKLSTTIDMRLRLLSSRYERKSKQ